MTQYIAPDFLSLAGATRDRSANDAPPYFANLSSYLAKPRAARSSCSSLLVLSFAKMTASSPRFSFSELFNIVNTPMVPILEARPADLQFALKEMPARNYTHSVSSGYFWLVASLWRLTDGRDRPRKVQAFTVTPPRQSALREAVSKLPCLW